MNLKTIKLDFAATTGGTGPVFLAGIAEDLEYGPDNRPTGKKIGTVYTVSCPADGFTLLKVRTPEQVPPISADELAARNASGRFVYATFKGFVGGIFQDFRSERKEVKKKAIAESIILQDNAEVAK